MRGLSRRPTWQRVTREAAEAGQFAPEADLILVENGGNLGFAAGNNVGLRLALAQDDMDCVWLLNNDTLVEPGCLRAMRRKLKLYGDRAACGSVIHFFDQPEIIQALGGNRFNSVTGIAACSEGRFLHESATVDVEAVSSGLSYLSGCSMLLPRAFLEEVGLMNEDYFLYYEEIDWFTRSGGRFPLCIAGNARLYHREGSSIGSPGWQRAASRFADEQLYRSRLIFMRRYHPHWLPLCYAMSLLEAAKHALRGRFANASAVLSVLFGRSRAGVPG